MPEAAARERAPEDQREYWLKKLSAEREPSGLVADYRSVGGDAPRTESVEAALPADVVGELDRVAANSPFLVYTALLTALKVCLHKYSGSGAVVVGSPPRKKQGGLFQRPNALAIVDEVRGDMSFRQLLSNVRETLLEAYAKQSYPYERVLQDSNLGAEDGRCPLFDIALALKEIHGGLLAVNNPITITFDRAGGQLTAVAEYDASLYRRESVAGLMRSVGNVLGAGLRNAGATIAELSPLDEDERRRVLVEWNDARIVHPQDRCIHHLIEARADATPDAVAVTFEGDSLSCAELDARSNRLARHLRGLGVGPEVPVGILVERSIEMVVGVLGVMKAGGAYVPLDPSSPPERLAMMVEDSGLRVLLTQAALAGTLAGRAAPTVVRLDADWPEIEGQSSGRLESSARPENLAYIIFTSGSTGRPKGVMVEHRALVSRALALLKSFGIDASDRLFQFVPLSFDASAQEIILSLVSGAALVLHRNPTQLTAADLLRTCERQGVTTLHLPPAFWNQVVDELASSRGFIPKWLKLMLSGGESVSMQRLEALKRLAKHRTRYINGYGPTEATWTTTCYDTPLDAETLTRWARLPIGRPLDETQVYVLDERQAPAPVGAEGELYIGGEGLARGYVGQPAHTAERFVPDPFSALAGARLYRTGDRARWRADGNLEFLGRRDAQVKVRGYRIELGEIESALLQHPRVRECAVEVRVEDGGEPRLVAYVVGDAGAARGGEDGPRSGAAESSAAELRQHLRGRVPDYMVPSAFVTLDRLPLMPNGKVDRRALSQIATRQEAHADGERAAPRTPVEEKLMEIWREVLRLGEREIGIDDNFFELGGDSILSIQIMARAGQAGLRLTPRDLFERPTVAGLAEVAVAAEVAAEEEAASVHGAGAGSNETEAGGRTREPTPSNFPLADLEEDELSELTARHDVEDIYRLSPMQEAMLFHNLYAPRSEVYFHQISVKLEGALDVEAFERAWQELARRHAILRTSFVWEGVKHPVQVVHRATRIPLEQQDWRGLGEGEQLERLSSLLEQERTRGFDMTEAPLMRMSLIRLDEEAYQFVWSQHHLLLDGWSGLLLLREVFASYEAYRAGRTPQLPAPRPYQDYIRWLQRQDMGRAEAFWRGVLAGFRAPTPLGMEQPHGMASGGQDGPDYEQQYLQLSAEATTALRSLARRNEVTLNTLVQGAWALLLSRHSGHRDVVFGTVVSGRPAELAGIESMVGLFINTLPVRVQLPPESEALPWLQQLQQQQAEARQYQYSPLVSIRGWSEVPPGVPLFESHLVFNNNPADEDAGPLSMSLKVQEPTGAGDEHHPLVLTATSHSRLILRISYERRRFLSSTVAQLLSHLELLLSNMLRQPHAPLSALEEMLAGAEREQQAAAEDQLHQLSAGKLKNLKRKSGD